MVTNLRPPVVIEDSVLRRASEHILETKASVILDANVLLWGELRHVHQAATMQSTYLYSSLGQFGYAFSDGATAPVAQAIGKSIGALLRTTSSESCRLAALDSAWARKVSPFWTKRIRGKTLVNRERSRARLIQSNVEPILKRRQISSIVMIGYFPSLATRLRASGHTVYCVDDGVGLAFPPGMSMDETISNSLLITTASYLCRTDYLQVQALAQRAEFSVLIAQTCHNMIEYHFVAGFDVVFSESFPPYSLLESELRCFHRI